MSLRDALLTQDLGCGELGNAADSCRELVNAAVSCGVHLVTQRPPARIVVDADLSCEVVLFTQHLPARIVVDADLSCEVVLFSQHPPARIVVDAALSCGVVLLTQHPPARHIDDADLSCEDCCSRRPILRSTFLHSRGSWQRGSASLTSLGSWQRQPWSRRLASPQAREGHHDTSECEDRSPDFFWAGNPAPFIFFFYVSTKEPVAQMVARITVSLIGVEAI
ncbi:unnamed protein product [Penicillium nalgiovense]|nr:unnamed protein product [Penicillium nalgiovense]